MDYHLRKIAESADSIDSLYFSRPGIFSNAVILKPEITSLIQDAEYRENLLFSSDGNVHFNRVVVPDEIQHLENEYDIEVLCSTAEQLLKVYPIPGAVDTIQDYRRRFIRASDNISKYEEIVEQQRRQLAYFNSSLTEELDDSSVVEKKILQTEREIESLQQELQTRQIEVC